VAECRVADSSEAAQQQLAAAGAQCRAAVSLAAAFSEAGQPAVAGVECPAVDSSGAEQQRPEAELPADSRPADSSGAERPVVGGALVAEWPEAEPPEVDVPAAARVDLRAAAQPVASLEAERLVASLAVERLVASLVAAQPVEPVVGPLPAVDWYPSAAKPSSFPREAERYRPFLVTTLS
jgi:hypothetical protein